MLNKQGYAVKSLQKFYIRMFLLFCLGFSYIPEALYSKNVPVEIDGSKKLSPVQFDKQPLLYYLYISDFVEGFIEIPTSNVSSPSPIISSKYLAGRAPLYNQADLKVGTCSASFLCMQNADGIYTDISNYISVDSGLIVTWFTPTTLINLELDSIVHSMVTECIVMASTKVGVNPYYGQTFDLIVSSDDQKIYFEFIRTGAIF